LAVDFKRSCYAGTWKLPSNPSCNGQYYFVPEGTPPFESYLWSRHWRANSNEDQPEFGEIVDAPEYWVRGDPPLTNCFPPWVIACSGGRYPLRIKVYLGPVADGSCTGCTAVGGWQVLEWQPGTCTWKGPVLPYCTNFPFGVRLYQWQLIHDVAVSRTILSLRKIQGLGQTFAWFGQTFNAWIPFNGLDIVPNLVTPGECVDWASVVTLLPSE